MIQSRIEISDPININKTLTLSSADIDIKGNSINQRFSIEKKHNKDDSNTMFQISDNSVFTLENIVINAKKYDNNGNFIKPHRSSLIYVNDATLVINEGTLITGSNIIRVGKYVDHAESLIFFTGVNSSFVMNGGEITNNYFGYEGQNLYAATILYFKANDVNINLLGGIIHKNIFQERPIDPEASGPLFYSSGSAFLNNANIKIAGDFTIVDNKDTNGNILQVFKSASANLSLSVDDDYCGIIVTEPNFLQLIPSNIKPGIIYNLDDLKYYLIWDSLTESFKWEYQYRNEYLINEPNMVNQMRYIDISANVDTYIAPLTHENIKEATIDNENRLINIKHQVFGLEFNFTQTKYQLLVRDYLENYYKEISKNYNISDGVKSVIQNGLDTFDFSIDSYQDIVDKISNIKDGLDLYHTKEIVISEIRAVYENYNVNDYTTENWHLLTKIKDDYILEITNLKSYTQLEELKVNALKEMKDVLTINEMIQISKLKIDNDLKDYFYQNFPEEDINSIIEIINGKVNELDESNFLIVDQLIDEGKNLIYNYYLKIAKDNKKAEIFEHYNKDDYSEEGWKELEKVIDNVLDEIERIEDLQNIDLNSELSEVPTLLD